MIFNNYKKYPEKLFRVFFIKKKTGKVSLFKISLLSVIISILIFLIIPSGEYFSDDYSTILVDRNNVLLGASIACDEQWRFPAIKNIPEKIEKCVITFEDKRFYIHPGVDPLALCRAIYLNISRKKIVSGGSTIPMQVIRISRKNKSRTITEKFIEMILSVKMSIFVSKQEILSMYLSHTPYGSNVVGIEAASWRYFGRTPNDLSWSEAALLTILPNNPSMIYPGKNIIDMKKKRDFLLNKLCKKGILSDVDCDLSKEEPLPVTPITIPQIVPHLLDKAIKDGYKSCYNITTLDCKYQIHTMEIIEKHYSVLKTSQIRNACAIIVKIDTGEVLTYVGNTKAEINEERYGNDVDIITSKRSPGSILKPFLFAMALSEGMILPDELLADIPLSYEGFSPRNMNKKFDGAVQASNALIRSLNVPFVILLRDYGYQKFYHNLEKIGIKFSEPSSYYSLSMILGGAEVSLWELTSAYAGMARVMKGINEAIHKNIYLINEVKTDKKNIQAESIPFDRSSVWFTLLAMKEVLRPNEEINWKKFVSSVPIAWKTGTSYGSKDGWAIGFNPEYLVGVWVGNASGEGRPDIKGISTAAPIMFDIFDFLPPVKWFNKPALKKVTVCKRSGMLASINCDEIEDIEAQDSCENAGFCEFHKILHLDENEKYQVDGSNYPVSRMKNKVWFVLPPIEEWYYKKANMHYKLPPPFKVQSQKALAFIYPPNNKSNIYVPIELDGSPGKTVFEIAHRNPDKVVYWHLDDDFIGITKNIHQFGLYPDNGKHTVTVVDENGNVSEVEFNIISKRKINQ